VAETRGKYTAAPVGRDDIARLIKDLEGQMRTAARSLEFEKAAIIRERIIELRKAITEDLIEVRK